MHGNKIWDASEYISTQEMERRTNLTARFWESRRVEKMDLRIMLFLSDACGIVGGMLWNGLIFKKTINKAGKSR
jgi:hypothetical protein